MDTFIGTKQLFTPNTDKNRMYRRGGGIAIVTQSKYEIIREPETNDYESFEHNIWNIPQGTDQKVNNANFLDQLIY